MPGSEDIVAAIHSAAFTAPSSERSDVTKEIAAAINSALRGTASVPHVDVPRVAAALSTAAARQADASVTERTGHDYILYRTTTTTICDDFQNAVAMPRGHIIFRHLSDVIVHTHMAMLYLSDASAPVAEKLKGALDRIVAIAADSATSTHSSTTQELTILYGKYTNQTADAMSKYYWD